MRIPVSPKVYTHSILDKSCFLLTRKRGVSYAICHIVLYTHYLFLSLNGTARKVSVIGIDDAHQHVRFFSPFIHRKRLKFHAS